MEKPIQTPEESRREELREQRQPVPLISKYGVCKRCGYHLVLICSIHDTSAPCPLCEDVVELESL